MEECLKMCVYGTVTYWAVGSLWLRRSLEIRPHFRGEQDAPHRTIDANKAGPGLSAVTLEELETFSSRKDHRGKVEEAGGCR